MEEFAQAIEQLAQRIGDWAQMILTLSLATTIAITGAFLCGLFITYQVVKIRESIERQERAYEIADRRVMTAGGDHGQRLSKPGRVG